MEDNNNNLTTPDVKRTHKYTNDDERHEASKANKRKWYYNNKEQALNHVAYMKTKFVRFLLSTILLTQNIAKDKFKLIPIQDFTRPWTDEELYKKYNLDENEIAFIESMIKPME